MRTQERESYDAFFRASYLPVVRTVHLVVHDRVLAEDVAQEAFYRLLGHWRTVSTYDLPEAWVRRVAIRIAVREVQRSAARAAKEQREIVGAYDDLPDPDLVAAVRELSPMQRTVVALYYWEDRPVAEMAEILEVSESTIKQHLHRARQRLAAMLREEVTDDAS
jgi:RNA polymerase sigma-70 factor (ECF subfamily)